MTGPEPRTGNGGDPAPRPLDRAAVERVLQRATELQAGTAKPAQPLLDERAVFEAAAELGLAPDLVRRALLEERAHGGSTADVGLPRRLAGPGAVVASRLLAGDGPSTLAALERWLGHEECLTTRRRRADEIVCEAGRDLGSRLRRAVPFDGRRFLLARAQQVHGVVADDGAGRVFVRLTADLRNERLEKLLSGGALAGLGAVGATVGALAGAPVPLDVLMAAAGAGAGAAVSRSHAGYAADAAEALERILDRVEAREEVRPSALGSAVGRGLSTGLEQLRRTTSRTQLPPPPPRPPGPR